MPFRDGRSTWVAAVLIGALVVLAGAATSCRPLRPCAAGPSIAVAPARRRDQCLSPPWFVDPARPTSGVEGWSAAVCPEGAGRSAYFIHEGSRGATGEETRAVLEASRGLAESSGLGGCCSPKVANDTQVYCLKLWSSVCRLEVSRIVRAVDLELRRQGLTNVRIGIDLSLGGAVGPRCEPTDPSCGPLSSRDWDRPDAPRLSPSGCVTGRERLAPPGVMTAGRTCAHDGECAIAGCGTSCLRWDQAPAFESCEDGPSENSPARYCGCVAGYCAWFRPVAHQEPPAR